MADYHIYIHSDKQSGSQTKPFSSKKEEGSASFSEVASTFSSTSTTIVNGKMAETGVSALTKAVPWVAMVVAAVKVADHIVSTGFAHQEEYTGNFRNAVAYNNFKTIVGNILNPVGFVLKQAHRDFQYNKQNITIQQQNKLVGSSILKDFNIGV